MQGEFWPNTGPTSHGGATSGTSAEANCHRATSSPVVSHAPTSAQQGTAPESEVQSPGYGRSSPVSFARFDPGTFSWKTPGTSLAAGSASFSGTWPRAGMMRNGSVYPLGPLVPRIFGTGASWLPTPRATDGARGGRGDLLAVLKGRPQHGYRAHPLFSAPPQSLPPGGVTSPEFVEWCMGLPRGWSSLDSADSATE